METRLDQL